MLLSFALTCALDLSLCARQASGQPNVDATMHTCSPDLETSPPKCGHCEGREVVSGMCSSWLLFLPLSALYLIFFKQQAHRKHVASKNGKPAGAVTAPITLSTCCRFLQLHATCSSRACHMCSSLACAHAVSNACALSHICAQQFTGELELEYCEQLICKYNKVH